jgi:hypothetical protein
VVADSPLPVLAIELIRCRRLQQVLIIYCRASRAECLPPTFTGSALRRDDQPIILNAQLDRIAQPALLDELGMRMPRELPIRTNSALIAWKSFFCGITL